MCYKYSASSALKCYKLSNFRKYYLPRLLVSFPLFLIYIMTVDANPSFYVVYLLLCLVAYGILLFAILSFVLESVIYFLATNKIYNYLYFICKTINMCVFLLGFKQVRIYFAIYTHIIIDNRDLLSPVNKSMPLFIQRSSQSMSKGHCSCNASIGYSKDMTKTFL